MTAPHSQTHTPAATRRAGTPRLSAQRLAASLAAGAITLTIAGCAASFAGPVAATSEPPAAGAALGSAAAASDLAFLGGVATPAPESTIRPEPGSWQGVRVPAGYRVELVAAQADDATDAVRAWLQGAGAKVDVRYGVEPGDGPTLAAVASDPDLVVGIGASVVDDWSMLTAQFLDQPFLVLGAQLAEPTENVTAVVWDGASFRGSGISPDDAERPGAAAAPQASAAIAAGMKAVLSGRTGLVVWLPN